MIQQIVFDMDGTLFSSELILLPAYTKAINNFNQQFPELKLNIPKLEEIIKLLGSPIKIIYKTLFPGLPVEVYLELKEIILDELCKAIGHQCGSLYRGVPTILKILHERSYELFIASNGQKNYLETILKTYHLFQFFHPITTLNDSNILDKGDILLEYQEKSGLRPTTTIMIGDRKSDLEAAEKLGCQFIGCDYGHGTKNELAAAKITIHSISDIIKWLDIEKLL